MHPAIDNYFESFDGAQYIPRPWLQALYPQDQWEWYGFVFLLFCVCVHAHAWTCVYFMNVCMMSQLDFMVCRWCYTGIVIALCIEAGPIMQWVYGQFVIIFVMAMMWQLWYVAT